jgi:hypothetical protein
MIWTVIVPAIIVFDVLLTAGLIWFVLRMVWGSMRDRFPAVEPQPDAVTRRYQSFRFGVVNFGCAIHVTADETHLHLSPLGFMQKLGGLPISIPWEAIAIKKPANGGKWTTVMIGMQRVTGPAWCLELAGRSEDRDGA